MTARYLEYYNLKEDPFRLTPDPAYYYPSQEHSAALLSLDYCTKQKEGFCLLTGEPGTGKTTLLRIFMNDWRDRAEIALIMTPRLSPEEFLRAVLEDFNLQPEGTNKNEMIKTFRDFLIRHSLADRRVAIVVDEAQSLPAETLEELRLLSNLETDREKLLQIILVGQPELRRKLRTEPLRQLNQRIGVRVSLSPLTEQETSDYLTTRLIRAGNTSSLFDAKVRRSIHTLSGGIPRVINLLASRGIMVAFLTDSPIVRKSHVRLCAKDILDSTVPQRHAWNNLIRHLGLFIRTIPLCRRPQASRATIGAGADRLVAAGCGCRHDRAAGESGRE